VTTKKRAHISGICAHISGICAG